MLGSSCEIMKEGCQRRDDQASQDSRTDDGLVNKQKSKLLCSKVLAVAEHRDGERLARLKRAVGKDDLEG